MVAMLRALGADATPPSGEPMASMANMNAAQLESQADALRRQKDYAEAIRYYKAAMLKEPKNSMLQNKAGVAELLRGNNAGAEVYFQKAVKLDSKNADALNNIAVSAYFRKNYSRAVKFYKKALAVDETNATYHSNLGTAWFSWNKLDHAVVEYTRAMELDPEVLVRSTHGGVIAQVSSVEDRARYAFVLAKLYAQHGDWERCFRCLQKAKEDGYKNMKDVYKDAEFAKLRQDPRLAQIVPPPAAAGY